MAEKKEWRGITINETLFQGKVVEDPNIVPMNNNERCAFMKLRTFVNELGANGQWTEVPILVPLVVTDQRKVDVVEKFVKAERELFIKSYYKSWGPNNENHGMVVRQMTLGSKGAWKRDEDIANTSFPK